MVVGPEASGEALEEEPIERRRKEESKPRLMKEPLGDPFAHGEEGREDAPLAELPSVGLGARTVREAGGGWTSPVQRERGSKRRGARARARAEQQQVVVSGEWRQAVNGVK